MAPVHEFPEEKWDAIIDVLLNAPFHATKAALPGMLEAGWGRVVNTGALELLLPLRRRRRRQSNKGKRWPGAVPAAAASAAGPNS